MLPGPAVERPRADEEEGCCTGWVLGVQGLGCWVAQGGYQVGTV